MNGVGMRVVIPDDYQDAVRHLACFPKLAAHDVVVYRDTVKDADALAERVADADALVLIRERTAVSDALLAKLPRLKLISQTGKGTAPKRTATSSTSARPSIRYWRSRRGIRSMSSQA